MADPPERDQDLHLVFRALADPNRRRLLDHLRENDGQTLGQLSAGLPDITRFGVAKHLTVLASAELVSVRAVGRTKVHYLNPVPLQRVSDRWIARFRQPFTRLLVDLASDLEGEPAMARPAYVTETIIRAAASKVWQALVDPEFTSRYYYGTKITADAIEKGRSYTYEGEAGPMIKGEILEAEEPTRLVMTFVPLWDPEQAKLRPSRVTFELTALSDTITRLSLVHDDFDEGSPVLEGVSGGWPLIIASLKTLLETGEPLEIPQG